MIWVIEDDRSIRELVCYTLNNTGFEAAGFPDGKTFWKTLEKESPQILILDIMLPDEDGISILKKLKSNIKTENIPVIMLTAKDTEFDKVYGLDSGADDYITKPFGMMELISRIKAVLRRGGAKEEKRVFSYGDLTIDDTAHAVILAGNVVDVTNKEYHLLLLLLENMGKVMTRDVILNKVWGYDFDGETRTVDVHVRSLRSKLGDFQNNIETVRGVGYRIGGIQ